MMYKCCDCGLVFDNPKVYSEDRTPYGGYPEPGFTEHFAGCPSCGGAFDEAMLCVRCEDTYISTESSYPFCAHCMSQLMNQYKKLIADNFREDEYDMLYDHLDSIEPYKKGE